MTRDRLRCSFYGGWPVSSCGTLLNCRSPTIRGGDGIPMRSMRRWPARYLWLAAIAGAVATVHPVNAAATAEIGTQAASTVTDYSNPISRPQGIAVGPDGALWFTDQGTNSISRITTSGKVTTYTGQGISSPVEITAGPGGSMWFTNYNNNSIGRITMSGKVTNYTGKGISGPYGIAAGPGGAVWFTNHENNSIGRITKAGHVSNFGVKGISKP